MQAFTDYFIGVYYSGEVVKLSRRGEIPNSDIRFLIHCEYQKHSTTGKTVYYKNLLFDSSNVQIPDNHFKWSSIRCKIIEDEKWEIVKPPNHHGVSLSAIVWDKLDIKKDLKFNNSSHNGLAFQALFTYLNDVSKYDTHNALKTIKQKEKQIKLLRQEKSTERK